MESLICNKDSRKCLRMTGNSVILFRQTNQKQDVHFWEAQLLDIGQGSTYLKYILSTEKRIELQLELQNQEP
jgi:hypothetical protein